MPSLQTILEKTMFFKAVSTPIPRAASAPINAPPPTPTPSSDENVIRANPCWSWTHDPSSPAKVTDIGCKVRGMGMNYKMVMPVCTSISVDEVMVRRSGYEISLPLKKDFVLQKYYSQKGSIANSSWGLWQLESNVDQSLLVVFGYRIAAGDVTALTMSEVEKLGDKLMPEPGTELTPDIQVDQKLKVWVGNVRVIVCFSLTCCKERPDFEPGEIFGVNRLYPHVMVMSSATLENLNVSINVSRPAKAAHSGPMLPTTAANPDEMLPNIEPVLFTDSNDPLGVPPPPIPAPPPLPLWDNFFDYYETDPIANTTIGTNKALVVVDASKPAERRLVKALMKIRKPKPSTPPVAPGYQVEDLIKLPRQGEFDNLHLAPKMAAAPKAYFDPAMKLSRVAMAPFCIHDCLHMHVRWGLTLPKKSNKGFDSGYTPHVTDGAPLVPHDQTIKLTLLSPSSYQYEASVAGPVKSARWNVFFHHGMGYANEIWAPSTVDTARTAVEIASINGEHNFAPNYSATNSWAIFYWRLRYGGLQNKPMERIVVGNLDGCRKF